MKERTIQGVRLVEVSCHVCQGQGLGINLEISSATDAGVRRRIEAATGEYFTGGLMHFCMTVNDAAEQLEQILA